MRRVGLIGTIAAAAMMLSGVAASGAWAVEGPFWLVEKGGVVTLLNAGEEVPVVDLNLGNFVLTAGAGIKLECTEVHSTGTLIGGNPGKDTAAVTFLHCTVNGHPECDVRSAGQPWGTIFVESNTELVYLEPELNAHVGDLFTPKGGNTFVAIQARALSANACPNGISVSGSEEGGEKFGINPINGSVAAKVEPVLEHVVLGKLVFPGTRITKVYKNESGTLKEFKPALSAFGSATATFAGTEDIKLESEKLWGVED